jgi:hypothetical protein
MINWKRLKATATDDQEHIYFSETAIIFSSCWFSAAYQLLLHSLSSANKCALGF